MRLNLSHTALEDAADLLEAIRSSLPRTNGCMIAVTPQSFAMRMCRRSASVIAGARIAIPGSATLFRLSSKPPRTTSSRSGPSVFSRSFPSSSRISCPGAAALSVVCTVSGNGIVSMSIRSPSRSDSGFASVPIRRSGPCMSISSCGRFPQASAALRQASSRSAASSSAVWDRFSRMPSSPSESIRMRVSQSPHAGPSVP